MNHPNAKLRKIKEKEMLGLELTKEEKEYLDKYEGKTWK